MILVVANASCPQTTTRSFDIARKIANYSCFSSTSTRAFSDHMKLSFVFVKCRNEMLPEPVRRSTVCSRLHFCRIKFTVLFGIAKVTVTYRCDIPL
ncbi:hypothetical protein Zmor_021232 [Zophobas morio]|uniref:Uncharacterized protein n=1 Tax=Zophobas morio TaxID=2755281 RepID=A0AA38MB61_9CUCU|nr:hypothetical protein Zmor_021232 [Zophobas morio]